MALTLARKRVVLGIVMVAALLTVFITVNLSSPTEALASGACGSRAEASVPSVLRPYIEKACYDTGVWNGAGVQLYITREGYYAAAMVWGEWHNTFASFLVHDRNWKGDRSMDSVAREIKWHARSNKTAPFHIEYRCQDLGWYEWIWRC